MKNKKNLKITAIRMREYGFIDGYSGEKSKEDEWLQRFCNKKMNINIIKEYVEAYKTGYQVGQCSLMNLENIKIKKNEVTYNGRSLSVNVNMEQLQEKVKILTPIKKKGRRR